MPATAAPCTSSGSIRDSERYEPRTNGYKGSNPRDGVSRGRGRRDGGGSNSNSSSSSGGGGGASASDDGFQPAGRRGGGRSERSDRSGRRDHQSLSCSGVSSSRSYQRGERGGDRDPQQQQQQQQQKQQQQQLAVQAGSDNRYAAALKQANAPGPVAPVIPTPTSS
jgi:hypothetical protein